MKNLLLTIISFLLALGISAQVNFNNNTVSAENYSSALGENNMSTGTASFVSGYNSQATGIYSTALGHTALATGMHSLALGSFTTAEGPGSVAIGPYAFVNSNASMGVAIGNLVESHMPNSFIIGTATNSNNKFINNVTNSLMIGFGSTKPTLFVGGATANGYSGKIGIGNITDPQAKLHIKADIFENASLKLEPTSSDYEAQILLGDDVHTITAKPNNDFKFSIPSGRNFVFENGKIKTTGFQLTDGQQGEGKYLRSDADGNASWATSNVPCLDCLASGQYSSTIGMNDTATGVASFAVGSNSHALGNYSNALGWNVTASGMTSCSFGAFNTASGAASIAMGSRASATQTGAIAIGNKVDAHASYSYVIGYGLPDNYLTNYTNNSLMIGFNSNKSTFFVGESNGEGTTGKIGIGDVTDPQAKLHIKMDVGENAAIRIEPWSWTNDNYAEIQFGNEDCTIRGIHSAGLNFFSTYKFVFHTGNVGIGTGSPLAKLQVNGDVFIEDENSGLILKSPDGQCWKITVNNSGELTTTSIDCNLTTGEVNTPQPEKNIIRIYPNPAKSSITIENTYNYIVYATLRDIDGTLIITQKLQTGDNTLNIDDLATGTYIITILDSQNLVISSEKIMKK